MPSLAERLEPACAALEADPALVALPERLALFGLTRLPVSHLRVLRALAAGRDVHLMLLHPSPAMWAQGESPTTACWLVGPRRPGLCRRWSAKAAGRRREASITTTRCRRPGARGTLLEACRATSAPIACRRGRRCAANEHDGRLELAAGDRSVRVHACHGRARQVEVLREAILHRLADDPTLEPRDVIVMCPDIESFAPLIEAAFGGRAAGTVRADSGVPTLRVRLADRSLRRTTPVLAVAARLLELASSRVTASEVLDLADTAPVRARFGFDDDELAQIRDWVAGAHIHWGLDAAARGAYKLTEVDAGTWAAGLERLLLGVAMDPDADRHCSAACCRPLRSRAARSSSPGASASSSTGSTPRFTH